MLCWKKAICVSTWKNKNWTLTFQNQFLLQKYMFDPKKVVYFTMNDRPLSDTKFDSFFIINFPFFSYYDSRPFFLYQIILFLFSLISFVLFNNNTLIITIICIMDTFHRQIECFFFLSSKFNKSNRMEEWHECFEKNKNRLGNQVWMKLLKWFNW